MEFNGVMRINARFYLVLSLVFCWILCIIHSPIASAQDAKFFVGQWNCEAVGKQQEFTWEAEIVLDGRWLSGKTKVKGILLSIDYWRVESNGQPSFRRLFLSDGSFVETTTKHGWRKNKLRMQGLLQEKKRVIETRETLFWKDENTLEASIEQRKGSAWKSRGKEICRRQVMEKS